MNRVVYTIGAECPDCQGTGRVDATGDEQRDAAGKRACDACGGTGVLNPDKYYLVETGELIPAPSRSGAQKFQSVDWEVRIFLREGGDLGLGGGDPQRPLAISGHRWYPFAAGPGFVAWRRAVRRSVTLPGLGGGPDGG